MRDGAEDFLEKRAAKTTSRGGEARPRATREREAPPAANCAQRFGTLTARELEVLRPCRAGPAQ
jgi:FixJ family two-component response regulator